MFVRFLVRSNRASSMFRSFAIYQDIEHYRTLRIAIYSQFDNLKKIAKKRRERQADSMPWSHPNLRFALKGI